MQYVGKDIKLTLYMLSYTGKFSKCPQYFENSKIILHNTCNQYSCVNRSTILLFFETLVTGLLFEVELSLKIWKTDILQLSN